MTALYEVVTRHAYGEAELAVVRVWSQLELPPALGTRRTVDARIGKLIQAFRTQAPKLPVESLGEYLCARDTAINAVEVTDHFGLGYVYYREWP